MHTITDRLVEMLHQRGLIDKADIPWVRYGIQKRLLTFVGIIPLLLLGIHIAGFRNAVMFISSFYLLRPWCNGYHAKTPVSCLITSLLIEVAFLLGIRYILTPHIAIIVNILSCIILLIYAPYNHPKMHYTQEEIVALKAKIRKTLIPLEIAVGCALILQFTDVLYGLTAGVAMTTFMLYLAYIKEWRYPNEND